MASRLAIGKRLLYFKRPGPFDAGKPGERLPEAYKKFWNEWRKQTPSPVHFIPESGRWKRDSKTGVVFPIQNIPIRAKYPAEFHSGLWGGEGIIQGFTRKKIKVRRNPEFWIPSLKQSVVYSEILDKYMSVTVTERTIRLIHQHSGFDHYILKTPACDLKSEMALKIKRELLKSLLKRTYYPDDPKKHQLIFEDYNSYLDSYTEEDIEWYGLNYREACKKLQKAEAAANPVVPLKIKFREDLLHQLIETAMEKEAKVEKSWFKTLNPFQQKSETTTA